MTETYGQITCKQIQEAVAEQYGLTALDLIGPSKERRIAYPRQIAIKLCRDVTDLSSPQLGARFGGRDHSTILDQAKAANRRIRASADVRAEFQQILAALKYQTAAPVFKSRRAA